MWHLRVGNSKVAGSMLRTEVRADGKRAASCCFKPSFSQFSEEKSNSSYVGKQLSNWMRQLMQSGALIHSSILNTA